MWTNDSYLNEHKVLCKNFKCRIIDSYRNEYKVLCEALRDTVASLVAQLVKNPPAMRETWVQSLGGKIPWKGERLPTPVFWSGEFHGLYIVHGVAKSRT